MNWALRAWLAFCASFGLCGPAAAVVIGFSPESSAVAAGDRFGVDIVVSELGGPAGPDIVSAFDIDVLYDTAFLSGVDFSFSDALGIANVDTFAASFSSVGRFDLANLSFLSNSDLFALQADSIVLGRLIFDAIGIGNALLAFDTAGLNAVNLVGTDPFASLPVTARSAVVSVTSVAQVPEPGTLVLFSIALLAVGVARARPWGHA